MPKVRAQPPKLRKIKRVPNVALSNFQQDIKRVTTSHIHHLTLWVEELVLCGYEHGAVVSPGIQPGQFVTRTHGADVFVLEWSPLCP